MTAAETGIGTAVSTSEERRARNEAIFRQANEAIRRAQDRLRPMLPRVPFICECPDTSCRQLIRLPLDRYEAVRGHAERFIVLPGHEDGATVVDRGEEWCVIEKDGREGKIARQTDPRGEAA